MNKPRIIPQPATKTPGKFQKQTVQLDPCNIDDQEAIEKPHSRLFFHGGDILADIENALSMLNPPAELLHFPPAFYLHMPVADTGLILERIGFRKEVEGSSYYFRPSR
jgi:hypothetical protein